MSSLQEPLPGEFARRWLACAFPPRAMESVFDPFIADLQTEWLHAKSTRGACYTRWSLFSAYVSLSVQVAAFAIGSLFGPSYDLAPAASSGAPHVAGGMPAARTSRYAAPMVIAGLITFGLFTVMSSLIAGESGEAIAHPPAPVRLVNLPNEPEPIREPDPALPRIPDPVPRMPEGEISISEAAPNPVNLPPGPGAEWLGPIQPGFTGPTIDVRGADQSEIPTVRVEPVYPQRALDRGIEGWVEVEFTVTEVGSVSEPRILRSHPSAIFDRAALRAIEQWKYEPKVVDGQPVSRPGVRSRFRFELNGARPQSD